VALGAVVEVAFDTPPFLILGRDEAFA